MNALVLTVGHSTRSLEDFIQLLLENLVRTVVDVRTVPRSRHNPQFNADSLAESLGMAGLLYENRKDLGGLRHPRKDSPNGAWRNDSFRGFADYMQTEEFAQAVDSLAAQAVKGTCALMCAETVPWRCHRSLIADALTVRGLTVVHIIGPGKTMAHALTPWAVVDGLRVTYPSAVPVAQRPSVEGPAQRPRMPG
jgi:uncharacterized protein (DUF488 family)